MRKNYRIFSKEIIRFVSLCNPPVLLLPVFLFLALAGVAGAHNGPETEPEEWLAVQACDVFQESNGVVVVQAETKTASGWAKKSADGATFLEWNGQQYFSKPVGGKITYKVKFNSPGIYRFVWRSKINQGNDDAEHNDTWLKFPNNSNITFFGHARGAGDVAADLKAKRNVVFPRGTGLSPVPNGSSSEGWFKVYMNRLGWNWIALTSDHDPHFIYVEVKQAGTYDMQIAGRSYKHAIDGMVLYHIGKKGNNLSNSVLDNLLKSVKDCSDIPTDPTPSNSAPTISSITNKTVTEGQTAKATVNASDANGDNISLSVVIKKGTNTVSSGKYTFASKNNGTLGELTFPTKVGDAGEYQVTVNASDGKASSSKTFKITVTKAGEPVPDPDPVPTDGKVTIYLVNANTNQDIKVLENNASFGIGVVGIRAATTVKVTNGVRFTLTGGPNNMYYRHKEGEITPYSLFGDKGTTILPWTNIKAGSYKLLVEILGTSVSKTINFTVTGGSDPAPDPTPDDDVIQVVKFYLINPSTNQRVKELKNGDVIASGQVVNVEAVTNPAVVGSVRFALNGKSNFRTESVAPYALGGDTNGNYSGITLPKGSNVLTAIPYTKSQGSGVAGKSLKITFTVGSSARVAQSSGNEKTTVKSVGEQLYSDLKIARFYPNPVAEELTVEYTGQAEEGDIRLQLVNRLGVVYPLDVQTYQIEGNTIKVNLGERNLSAGVYILKVQYLNTGKAEVFRLIKY